MQDQVKALFLFARKSYHQHNSCEPLLGTRPGGWNSWEVAGPFHFQAAIERNRFMRTRFPYWPAVPVICVVIFGWPGTLAAAGNNPTKMQARFWGQVLGQGLDAGPSKTASSVPVPGKIDIKDLDRQLYEVLKNVINEGADLYNKQGDHAGCYRLYQGSLLTVQPLLAHRPGLQKEITIGLDDADRQPTYARRAFALRKVFDKVRAELKPIDDASRTPNAKPSAEGSLPMPAEKKPTIKKTPPVPASLWTRLGGEQAIRKVVDDFVALAATDPKVNFSRGGRYKLSDAQTAHLKDQVVAFISSATGGPLLYKGKGMREAHKGMGITNAEFDAAVADLRKALEARGVKSADAQDLLQIVESTRKDIVEPKASPEKKPGETKSDAKGKG